jgi:hypothetical protein
MEIANAVESVQDGRIFIALINGPFLYEHKGSPAEYGLIQPDQGGGEVICKARTS